MNKNIIVKLSGEFFEAAVIVLILYYVIFPVKITGESMHPTLENNDRVLMSRAAAMLNLYDTGDIVVLNYNDGTKNIKIVKRVAAKSGDKISIKDGRLYINDMLKENYDCKTENTEYILSNGEYFVLGDNSYKSTDSRAFGAVKKEDIKGLVVLRFYPFGKTEILLGKNGEN